MPLFNRIIEASLEKDNLELIKITDFHISFSIKKVSSTDPNTCTLKIYNLKNDTRNRLNELGALLTVNAGYQQWGGPEIIFIGNLSYIMSEKLYPNTVVTLEGKDGEEALNLTRDSISFKEGVSTRQILDSVIKKFGIGLKTKLDLINFINKKYNQGFAFIGQLKDLLDKITKDTNLEWSVQNNELKFYNSSGVDLSTAIVINKNTGMIGSPQRIKIKKGKRTKKVEIDGWKVESLLHPKAEPGGIINLSSEEVGDSKQFKIDTVEHIGDNFEGNFKTIMEVIEYE